MKFINGIEFTDKDIHCVIDRIVKSLNHNPYHDKDGKFTTKDGVGDKNIEKATKSDIIKQTRKEIELPTDEYAMVLRELNTNLTAEQRKKRIVRKYIGNYLYTVINNGFNEYKIIGKDSIDDI